MSQKTNKPSLRIVKDRPLTLAEALHNMQVSNAQIKESCQKIKDILEGKHRNENTK